MAKRRSSGVRGLRVAVLGTGRAGSAFARALADRGARVATWSRSSGRALESVVSRAELVLLCVRDDAIASLASRIARAWRPGAGPTPVALHLSGYHGARPLAPLVRMDWPVGSLHPLVPMTGRSSAPDLFGAWFATSAKGRAAAMASRVVRGLAGRELRLARGDAGKPSWHLACALVANGAVALFDAALEHAGAAAAPALASMLGTVSRRLASGPKAALAGPVSRAETEVVLGHLALLRSRPADAAAYRLLSRRLLALSDLPARERRAMARILR